MWLLLALLACDKTPPIDTAACNTDNEDCAPGSCGGEGPSMLPGADCIGCHDGTDGEAPKFTIAGTVFEGHLGNVPLEGATVHVTGADGTEVKVTSNAAGNFYSTTPVQFPITASVETASGTMTMPDAQDSASCNQCHSCTGEALGKLYGEP